MARLYKDYISVNKHFFPVFSKNLDAEYPEHWKAFVPHDTFKRILDDLAGSLEMASTQSRRSLWISGAYGTGKTYASFAVKHILEDDIGDVTDYFQKQGIGQTISNRLKSIKQKGNILVVHRSSTAGITGDNKLFGAIQESIKQALKGKGYQYWGGKSLYSNIVDKLTNPDSPFNFSGVFNQYREKFTEYAAPSDVIKDLQELDIDGSLDLLQRIIEVADRSGFNFSQDPDDVIAWIKDIIEGNNLYTIVFIWDEFTEFFKNNQNALTGLQELAQASFTVPFYFLLITHLTHSQVIPAADSRKKIEARFKLQTIEMPDTTAFMLMKNVIQSNPELPELKEEWGEISRYLWSGVQRFASTTKKEEIKREELRAILPIHPYAAYMLKVISAVISSNQRTMFQFLCGEILQGAQSKRNFRWYIENHSIDDWCYLTTDYLWDYFFTPDNPDFDEANRNTISHYMTFENQCDDEDDKRVLKTTLLLSAMRGGIRPTLLNISAAFEGTHINDKVRTVMDKLVKKGVLGSIPDGNDILYVTQVRTIDEERLRDIINNKKGSLTFERIVKDCGINSRYDLSGYLKTRCYVESATNVDIRNRLNETAGKLLLNKIIIVFLYAKNDEDASKNHDIITKILQEYKYDIIIADMSSQPLGQHSYDNYIDQKARAEYFSKTDHQQVKFYDTNAKGIITEWIQKLDVTIVSLYTKGEPPVQLRGPANFREKIKEINNKLYPNGLETAADMDTLFKGDGYSEITAVMGMDKKDISSTYKYLDAIRNQLIKASLWKSHDYEKINPSHSVSKMKTAIESLIKAEFDKNNYIEITDIWQTLQLKPFGLMNCVGSVFLLGFLLKEYADSKYYRHDGTNTVPLTHDGLADMIYTIVKKTSMNKNLRIVRMTPEHELFCSVTADIFTINPKNSIQDILHGLNTHISKINFPLWAIRDYVTDSDTSGLKDTIIEIVDLLCEFVSSKRSEGRDHTKIAEEIARLYQAGIKDNLIKAATQENMKIGMDIYIGRQKPEIKAIADKLGIGNMGYILALKEKLSADASWLWDKSDIDNKIEEVYEDYRLIDAINRILASPASDLGVAAHKIKAKIGAFKMPFDFFKDTCKPINQLFFYLIDIYKTDSLRNTNAAALITELEQNSDMFNKFYSDQYKIFIDMLPDILNEPLSDDECAHIYKKMESDSILKSLEQYLQELKQCHYEHQKNKSFNALLEKWKELTATETPKKWSESRKIPVLCLFGSEIQEAMRVFGIINKELTTTDRKVIENAIKFLKQSRNIAALNDIDLCNKTFKEFISGEYEIIFTEADLGELKNILQSESPNIYNWYHDRDKFADKIKKFGNEKYNGGYYKTVFDEIDRLTPVNAKDYLKELIKNDPLVGIRIMKSTKTKT
ncbi:hypothetical protein [Candidatus Magnetominusculus xianensis]|uniref:ATP-binding protein n=1 Tax=Candidatus Magnetominusculus xianensis TaxID=1748249 RepID=A0ABR5SFA4_9BACT|nr:hypothetical protein [Candidatus Magnetominusculus xianensis]KWT75634.1 hypothetical protein ASN18_3234 [Candidatus Magnetominusculus xianensis]MBF0403717.1 hypothetical protein [Nitrospirota bacterium]